MGTIVVWLPGGNHTATDEPHVFIRFAGTHADDNDIEAGEV
jgi:hypothetical protein